MPMVSTALLAAALVAVNPPAPLAHSFTFSGRNFMLDGKPFQIMSGELHPARIPPQYWRHRLRLAKAMGLNTVAIYLFWSSYETAPDTYDFKTGARNVAEFLRLAQAEGLWVLLRPGPYCCGEWDLGGIPWQLLKAPDIKLRSMDPRYTTPVSKYIAQLAGVIRPYLAKNGGPILMVQLENEYGSYPRRDHTYIRWLHDLWQKNGVDGPFYHADGASDGMLKDTVLPGVAIGLDPGMNDGNFEVGYRMNPDVPVFSSETYPGWLRHWGEGNWEPSDITGALQYFLATDKSFNLYMFDGGTNFGFTAGANSGGKGYEPDLTSYDYAAPVNEQGRPTADYYAFRKLLGEGRALPDVPAPIPAMAIPSITVERLGSLWAGLGRATVSEVPLCFEDLNQSLGLMVYRTRIHAGPARTLSFTNLHDYGEVFVGGKYLGTLDRRLGERSIELPACSQDAELEVLVEAMGHINFGIELETDRKGIYGPVTLDGQALTHWSMQGQPLSDRWAGSVRTGSSDDDRPGGVFAGTFNLTAVADTYIDLSHWTKGVVWVNGHNLGRFWRIGPQQRLYCPAPWLRRGANKILVVDLQNREPQPLSGHETVSG